MSVRTRLLLAATLPLAAWLTVGPPHIHVEAVTDPANAPTAGAVLAVTAEHHQADLPMTVAGRMESVEGGRRVSRALTLTPAQAKGAFGVARQWTPGRASVLVFGVTVGDHGAIGPIEALVRITPEGRVAAIEYATDTRLLGGRSARKFTAKEIDQALEAATAKH